MATINVHLLPDRLDAARLTGSTCVVIDILRATTTIVHALAQGARCVIPFLNIDDARAAAASFDGAYVLGGERGGKRIEGFDYGNSPSEYCAANIAGKTVLFTTTNGTRAMKFCQNAAEIPIGALVNLSAVCQRLESCQQIELVCAGTDGQITCEDVLFAGGVVDRLTAAGQFTLNDEAVLARDAWRAVAKSESVAKSPCSAAAFHTAMVNAMRESRGGANLIALGMDADIETAAQIDRFAVVPRLDAATWRIELS